MNNDFFDPYFILGVSKKAGIKKIKKQFSLVSSKIHPDINNTNENEYEILLASYQILSDSTKRKTYDAIGIRKYLELEKINFDFFILKHISEKDIFFYLISKNILR